ncbi:hypothetical protein [Georgenia sp. Marseille-Q6866]
MTDHSRAAGGRLSWVLVGVLAVIAASLFLLDGPAQSAAITGGLIAGLAGIAWAGTPRRERG